MASAIHMEKQLGWAHKLGWAESLGISKVGQTLLARLMVSNMVPVCQLHSITGGGLRKGKMTSGLPNAAEKLLQVATLALELRGNV